MSQKIRTAIVGCGKIAHSHAQALTSLPQSEFVAVCSRSREKAEACARSYGVLPYTDFERMLAEAGVQAVVVCTPHPNHADYVVAAARAGVHCLVEKPLASDLQDCDRAITACQEAGVRLGTISQRRFYPPVMRMHQAISAGKIGQPILAEVVVLGWRDEAYYQLDPWRGRWDTEGGGVMVNQTPHQLDLLQWLMGPIDELFGYWDNLNHPYVEIEDTAVAVMRFKNGGLGYLVLSNSQRPGLYGKIHIHGSNGASVGAQPEGGSPFVYGQTTPVEPAINDIWTVPGEEHLLPTWQEADRQTAAGLDLINYYIERNVEEFLQALQENREPLVTGEDGRRVVEIFTAVYRSQRDRRPVKFPLAPEIGRTDYDGRLGYIPFSHRNG